VLGERFVVERRLGSGGMGYVVAARHPELEERVAIKLIQPGRALSEEARSRLVREARAAARIRSAHVVRIFDVVSKGPGAPYLVMEYLEGETLGQLLDRSGPLPVERAVEIVVQACEPLAEAHRNGTIHRDIKPSNLFLTAVPGRTCFVKVLDFGIAKTREAGAPLLTQSHALLASPAYASPEQLRASKEVDERSDIWSLGVILYECVTGRLPFGGRVLAEVSSEILRDQPQPPSAHRNDVPKALERAILRCLEKEPTDRFESVDALVTALQSFAPESARECLAYIRDLEPKRTAPVAPTETPVESSHPSTLTHASVASRAERSNPKRTGFQLVGAALGAVILLIFLKIVPSAKEPSSGAPTQPSATLREASARPPPAPALSFAAEHPAPGPEAADRGSVAPQATIGLTEAKARTRVTPARASKPSLATSASARPERKAPNSLETLPLNDLIDGRK
jgi:eukaryotic-like serine/threonine-protein kinase